MHGFHRALKSPSIAAHESRLAGAAWVPRAARVTDPVKPHPWPPVVTPGSGVSSSSSAFIASCADPRSSLQPVRSCVAAAMAQDCPASTPQTGTVSTGAEASMQQSTSDTSQQQPVQTECLAVDPASFPWSAASGAASTSQQGQCSPTSSQFDLTHIQHDSLQLYSEHTATATQAKDLEHLKHAASLIQQGHTVAIPTETVYGLAANALNASSVKAIYSAKQRPADNPLIVHISSLDMLQSLYPPGWTLPDIYTQLVATHWPGPLTILLPKSPKIPDEVVCGQPTMAVRMPSHPVARALITLSGCPLAAPSANSSGKPSPTTAQHVMQDLAGRVPLVLDGGPCTCGVESTVLDGLRQPPVVLRPGGVTVEQLAQIPSLAGLQVYQKHFVDARLEAAPTTPGMKYRHYSPRAPITLLDLEGHQPADLDGVRQAAARKVVTLVQEAAQQVHGSNGSGADNGCSPVRVGVLRTTKGVGVAPGLTTNDAASSSYLQGMSTSVIEYVLGDVNEPEIVARELFRALRCMDEMQVTVIVAEGVLEHNQGLAVMNRLRKAASHTVRLDMSV